MWDILILTAGSKKQKDDFEIILENLNLTKYTNIVRVYADDPPGVRIGSGGCMFYITKSLADEFGEGLERKKILLIHSGGWSQRMPHLSCFGKIFAHLPGGKTVLELKLETYKRFPKILRPGIMVAASDVIEDTSNFIGEDKKADMLLFANHSHIDTATQHGVFILDHYGKLQTVLQKPSKAEIIEKKALQPDGLVLTDCFYWISWNISTKLSELYSENLKDEICCYGDFMRPLGQTPDLRYLEEGQDTLRYWRKKLANVFSATTVEIIDLGSESFFHLGTVSEFLEHIHEKSVFAKKFNIKHGTVYSNIENCTIRKNSYIEYCNITSIQVSSNCILSGLQAGDGMHIPENSIIFTICTNSGYVTFFFHTHDDIKKKQEKLLWMKKDTGLRNCSLWDAAIFPIQDSRQLSLNATLSMLSLERVEGTGGISVAQAIENKNLSEMERYRHQLRLLR